MQQQPLAGVVLYALDRPGFGGSTAPPHDYTVEDFIADINFFVDGLGLADFDLIDDLGVAGLAVCSALSAEGRFGVNLKAFVERARSFEPVEVPS